MAFEGLFAEHGAPVAFHGPVVRGDELRCNHALDYVFRGNFNERYNSCAFLLVACCLVGMLNPERLKRLVDQNAVPIIRLRPANKFKPPFMLRRVKQLRLCVSRHGFQFNVLSRNA